MYVYAPCPIWLPAIFLNPHSSSLAIVASKSWKNPTFRSVIARQKKVTATTFRGPVWTEPKLVARRLDARKWKCSSRDKLVARQVLVWIAGASAIVNRIAWNPSRDVGVNPPLDAYLYIWSTKHKSVFSPSKYFIDGTNRNHESISPEKDIALEVFLFLYFCFTSNDFYFYSKWAPCYKLEV